jgi:hypothetical protein
LFHGPQMRLLQRKPFVSIVHHLVTFRDVADPIDIRHKHAGFARPIGTLIPVVAGIPQRSVCRRLYLNEPRILRFICVGKRVNELYPWV